MKSKAWIAVLCCGAMILPSIKNGSISYAAEKTGDVKEYIIQAENDRKYEEILSEYEEEISREEHEEAVLEEENILLMDLTSEQAYSLDKEKGVSVERNVTLSGESTGEADREDVKRLVKEQWNVSAIQADSVKNTSDNKKVNVAIMDSGVDALSDVAFENQVSLIPEEDTDDGTGHGTIISNIMSSNKNGFCRTGIIPENSSVGLYNVRILDEDNQTPLSRVIEGLRWCIDNDMDVVNMSFGTEVYSEILHDAIAEAEEAGIVMVASVGNGGERGSDITEYPAGYREVIGVGSVNEKMEHSAFSNTGKAVELSAPGENIPVTSYWGLQGAGSGTSYAAAHVTAVAALLWSENPDRNAEEIRTLLDRSATDMGNPEEYGYGIVNYQNASEHGELADEGDDLDGREQAGQTEPEAYDIPISLKASWGYDNHASLVPSSVNGLTAHEVNVVKSAVKCADNDGELSKYDVLHARDYTNYVSATKCLYEAARKWKGGTDYSSLYSIADQYKSAESEDTATVKKNLKIAMRYAAHYEFVGKEQGKTGKINKSSTVTKTRGRLQLLALAIHVAGDAYAHKTMCEVAETRAVFNKNSAVLKDVLCNGVTLDTITEAVKNGLTTAALGKKFFKNTEEGKRKSNQYYADSTSYMGKRYSVATKVATNKLLNYYCNDYEFKLFVFCPYEISQDADFRKNYSYRLRRLRSCASASGYDFSQFRHGQNTYTDSDWIALSYDK